jgi:hypothetical protein
MLKNNNKENMFNSTLKKVDGKLKFVNVSDTNAYNVFVNSLLEDQTIDVFFDANKDDGTLAQLAKIHKCIREIAKETGADYETTKLHIKNKSGLCIKKEMDGESFMICKSFGSCSKTDLILVIDTIVSIGDVININFR